MGRPRVDRFQIMKECEFCGEILERKIINGRLEDNGVFERRKYCDRSCMAKAMIKMEEIAISTSRERATRNFREKQCGDCGVIKEKLHVHHIDRNPLNNDLENLKMLCFVCHMRRHKASSRKSPMKLSRP